MILLIKIIGDYCIFKCYFINWCINKYNFSLYFRWIGSRNVHWPRTNFRLSSGVVKGIVSKFEVFTIWGYVVTWLGLQITAGLTKSRQQLLLLFSLF